jgi:molybdopterin/thiamine biosynthesis adenylyltransferase/rhodanese-related sulfurtransferase
MDQQEALRYSRHFLLPEIGQAGQEKLRAARVLVIGAGGLGSPLALYLAAAGVGRLTVVDFDVVDVSNLQRQVLYSTEQVGTPKADAAAERLRALNPAIEVVPVREKLTAANALGLFGAHDVIADGADNFATRYLSNDAAVLARRPLVSASILGFEGQLSVFAHSGGPCFRCLYPEPPPAGAVPSCAENGVLGVLPGVMGLLQATEVLKLLLGIGEPLVGKLLYYDALRMDFQRMQIARNAACAVCGDHPSITGLVDAVEACEAPVPELDAHELKELLERNVGLQLLDVRDANELAICRIDGAKHIPLAELDRRFGELDKDRPVAAFCKMGGRSARAVRLLTERGFRAKSLTGGILAWASEIDSSLKRY